MGSSNTVLVASWGGKKPRWSPSFHRLPPMCWHLSAGLALRGCMKTAATPFVAKRQRPQFSLAWLFYQRGRVFLEVQGKTSLDAPGCKGSWEGQSFHHEAEVGSAGKDVGEGQLLVTITCLLFTVAPWFTNNKQNPEQTVAFTWCICMLILQLEHNIVHADSVKCS